MGEPVDRTLWGELEPEEEEEEESEEESEEEEDEEEQQETPAGGMQTPSGMETPSGMASVVSTVAGGLETPDFLELRKNSARAPSEATDSGPRSLYQVVPEKQTSVRGLMGSERGYDVSAVAGNGAIPVLGDERGTKVSAVSPLFLRVLLCLTLSLTAEAQRCGRLDRRRRAGRHVDGGSASEVRPTRARQRRGPRSENGGLLGHDWEGDVEEKAEGRNRQGASEREGLQVLILPVFRPASCVFLLRPALCMLLVILYFCECSRLWDFLRTSSFCSEWLELKERG